MREVEPLRERGTETMRGLAARYCLIVFTLLSAYATVSQMRWFERTVVVPHLEFVALGTARLLAAVGEPATVEGRTVRTSSFDFQTARGCDAIGAAVIVSSLILPFPTRRRARLAGVAVCTSILVTINFFRTTSLVLIGTHDAGLYDFAHRDLWQPVFALLSIGLFVAWIRLSAAPPEARRGCLRDAGA